MDKYFKFALGNVARYGDTDILPFPIENRVFSDLPEEALAALLQIHKDFNEVIHKTWPFRETVLSAAGYNGFRPATQIDPLWNAYFLGLVSSISDRIEQSRIPPDEGVVYSYRVRLDEATQLLFDTGIGWTEFQKRSIELAQESEVVLCTDISDFYPRINHHRLENALNNTKADRDIIRRIKRLLYRFSGGASYGLPVGGSAARLLSELLLNRTDRLLLANNITFCRFVDDYRIFANSNPDAYQGLQLLSEILLTNEGLTLQKNKTRIVSRDEYIRTNPLADFGDDSDAARADVRSFLRVRLRFDPYSTTADEDYKELRETLAKYDIIGMLGREVRKSRVDETLTKRLISSIRHLNPETKQNAILSLIDNLEVLYPLFSQVMFTLRNVYNELNADTKVAVQKCIRGLLAANSHIICIPTHKAYAIRVLALDDSVEGDALLSSLYKSEASMMIRRDIILAMVKRKADYWLSDCRNRYATLTQWEKTAMVIASFLLGDEGTHWRKAMEREFSIMAVLAMKWAESRFRDNSWEFPL